MNEFAEEFWFQVDRIAAEERAKVQQEMAHLRAEIAMLRSELHRLQTTPDEVWTPSEVAVPLRVARVG